MYCYYMYIGWCIRKYRGVLYSECPLSEVPLYMGIYILSVHRLTCSWASSELRASRAAEDILSVSLTDDIWEGVWHIT